MNAKNFIFIMIIFSTSGCGLMAGVFFAFSTFVMPGIDKLSTASAIAAMQSINAVVPGSLFGASFIVTPILCLLALIGAFVYRSPAGLGYIIGGTVIYLAGSLLVTMVFNIPLNDALAALSPDAADGHEQWRSFYVNWMLWNHVRGLSAGAASISYAIALFH